MTIIFFVEPFPYLIDLNFSDFSDLLFIQLKKVQELYFEVGELGNIVLDVHVVSAVSRHSFSLDGGEHYLLWLYRTFHFSSSYSAYFNTLTNVQEGSRRLKKVQDSPRRLKKAQEGLRRLKKF